MSVFDFRFRPRLVDSLKTYRGSDLPADISAGITVGVVALPLAMAFGIASGECAFADAAFARGDSYRVSRRLGSTTRSREIAGATA